MAHSNAFSRLGHRYMQALLVVLSVIAAYSFTVFFLARLFIPFMGFRKYMPPMRLPSDMWTTIHEMEGTSRDSAEYLARAYDFVTHRWHSERLKTITRLPLLFRTDMRQIWNSPGYAHCTTVNFVLYTLLARSRYFTQDDIRVRHTFFNGVLHQYLQVRIGRNAWIDAHPSTSYLNLPLGERARLFG